MATQTVSKKPAGLLSWLASTGKAWLGTWGLGPAHTELDRDRARVRTGASGGRLMFLPYADSNLTNETTAHRRAYRLMLAEPSIKAALLDKVLSVAALDLSTNPGEDDEASQKAAEFGKYAIDRVKGGDCGLSGLPAFVESVILPGLIDGYSVSEKIYGLVERGRWARKTTLTYLKNKDTEKHVTLELDDYNNVLAVVGQGTNSGERWHPSQFVIWRHLSIFDCPAGMSDLRAAYRAWWLIDTAWKLRAIYLEKWSAGPMLKGTYSDSGAQKTQLEAALDAARASTWISIPEGAGVEAINLATANDEVFRSTINDLKHEVFLGISGAILQALEGSTTEGRGSSAVHKSTADIRKWHIRACVESVLNSQVLPDLTDLNFAGATHPTANLGGIDDHEMTASLAIDVGLNRDLRLKLSRKDLYKRYGRPEPNDPEDTLEPSALPMGGFGLGVPAGTDGASLVGQPGDAGEVGAADPNIPTAAGPDLQETALNGAQIASLLEIVSQISTGLITPEAGQTIMAASFPAMSPEVRERIVSNLKAVPPQQGTVNAEPAGGPAAQPFRDRGRTSWGYSLRD